MGEKEPKKSHEKKPKAAAGDEEGEVGLCKGEIEGNLTMLVYHDTRQYLGSLPSLPAGF